MENLTQTGVETEDRNERISAYRRMDIYLSARINSETFGIYVENKPYANKPRKINLPLFFGVGKPQIEPKTFGLSM